MRLETCKRKRERKEQKKTRQIVKSQLKSHRMIPVGAMIMRGNKTEISRMINSF